MRCLIYLRSRNIKKHVLDLTVVGVIKHADGIGRIPIGVTELLSEDLKIRCLPTNLCSVKTLSSKMQEAVSYGGKTTSRVSMVVEQVYTIGSRPYALLPPSSVRLSYSMIESTRIPPKWTKILNTHFDAVVVPDVSLIDVYRHSGVKIPIFELPLGVELDPFFAISEETPKEKPFIFGTTVSCDPRKNIPLLIQAFFEEFGKDEKVALRINSRFGEEKACRKLIESLGMKNVFFSQKVLEQEEYVALMRSFHCFVNISMGEGFSICPREALALGIPCILSRNTAHKTLCDTGFVCSVPCPIEVPAFERIYGKEQLGYFNTCHVEDVKTALRAMYENYSSYKEKALQAKEWVSQYHWQSLKNKYLNLVKPQKVIFGEQNCLTEEGLITSSEKLYEKYLRLTV